MNRREEEFLTYLRDSGRIESFHKMMFRNGRLKNPERSMVEVLVGENIFSPDEIAKEFSKYYNLGYFDKPSEISPSMKFYGCDLPKMVSHNLFFGSLKSTGEEVVLITDPGDTDAMLFIDEVGENSPPKPVIMVASTAVVASLIELHKGLISNILGGHESKETKTEVEMLMSNIIHSAERLNASDIRVFSDGSKGIITLRIDGDVKEFKTINLSLLKRFRDAIMSSKYTELSEQNEKKPIVGKVSIPIEDRNYELRANFEPGIYGVDVNMRFLYTENISYHKLGMSQERAKLIYELCQRKYGMIVLAGGVGSGKTTTIYSLLDILKEGKTVVTVEDPVEHKMPGILQVNVSRQCTYADVLQSYLRHDPDVVVVGEIRSPSVAQEAVISSQTGKLLITTIHASSAFGVIPRLRNLGITNSDIADNLVAVIYQNLIKRRCKSCEGKGCQICEGSGQKGRLVVTELLVVNNALREGILDNQSSIQLQEISGKQHYTQLQELDDAVSRGDVLESTAQEFKENYRKGRMT